MTRLPRICSVITLVFALVGCGKNADPVAAATAFFTTLGHGQPGPAYESASFAFQAQQSFDAFQATVSALGLLDFSSIEWTRHSERGDEVDLNGVVTAQNGQKIPVNVTLTREGGKWKVFSLHTGGTDGTLTAQNNFSQVGKGAGFNDAFSHEIPPKSEVVALTRETFEKFAEALKEKSFTDFYNSIALGWQSQISKADLKRTFQPFIDAGVNLNPIHDIEPLLNPPPQLDAEGLLIVNGSYFAPPNRVIFSLKYAYEMPGWKLFGMSVRIAR